MNRSKATGLEEVLIRVSNIVADDAAPLRFTAPIAIDESLEFVGCQAKDFFLRLSGGRRRCLLCAIQVIDTAVGSS